MPSIATYPFTWKEIDDDERSERAKMWCCSKSTMVDVVRSTPLGVLVPRPFVDDNIHERIWNFSPRPDDVWLLTYPKSGSTLAQEIIWQLTHGCDVNSDETKEQVFLRVPFIEMSCLQTAETAATPAVGKEAAAANQKIAEFMKDPIEYTEKMEGPRVIKTHLPLSMLPQDLLKIAKVVLVARNPKDACTSFYHHEQLLPAMGLGEKVDFESYADKYMKGQTFYGSYWSWIKDCLKFKGSDRLLITRYEKMRSDLAGSIREIADFIGSSVSDDKLKALEDHCHIDKFRENDAVNMRPPKGTVPDEARDAFNFIRKGKVGDWKDHFKNPEMLQQFDEWIENNNKHMNGNLIEFDYE